MVETRASAAPLLEYISQREDLTKCPTHSLRDAWSITVGQRVGKSVRNVRDRREGERERGGEEAVRERWCVRVQSTLTARTPGLLGDPAAPGRPV